MAVIKYTKEVIEHFKNPKNVGEIENADGDATVGSPACGDQVSVSLKIKDNKIEDIKFLSYGCASNIATGSIVTELAKGKTVEEAKKMTWKDAVDELGGLPTVKVHCSVLAVDGLKAAIEDYEEKKLGVKHEKRLDEQSIIEELKSVIYPKTGNNIIDEKLVKYLKYENGKVEIEISFDETDVYKQNVSEEIDEHLNGIDGIDDIEVKVVEY